MEIVTRQTARRLAVQLLDALYPRRCVLCGSADALHEEWPLCFPCLEREEKFDRPEGTCRRCAMPVEKFFTEGKPGGCRWCRNHPLGFDAAAAFGPYEGRLRELIILYKYHDRLQLRDHLAYLAAEAAKRFMPETIDFACPVPPARSRLRHRGYDPILEFARKSARLLNVEFRQDALERIKDTPPLAKLSRTERKRVLKGAFRVKPGIPAEGARVIVLDDILTTGVTLSEAAGALKEAGAVRIYALVAGRTLDEPII